MPRVDCDLVDSRYLESILLLVRYHLIFMWSSLFLIPVLFTHELTLHYLYYYYGLPLAKACGCVTSFSLVIMFFKFISSLPLDKIYPYFPFIISKQNYK